MEIEPISYNGSNFSIRFIEYKIENLKKHIFKFFGELNGYDYKNTENFQEFFVENIVKIKEENIYIDIQNLTFSNSAGICYLCKTILHINKFKKSVIVIFNEKIFWQKIGIRHIIKLNPDKIFVQNGFKNV